MEIGNMISTKRKEKGLSQEQLAQEINVARQTISKWELDETLPDLESLRKLAVFLGFSIDSALDIDVDDDDDMEWMIIGFAIVGNVITVFFDQAMIGIAMPFIGLCIYFIWKAFRGNQKNSKSNKG